MSGLFVTGTDTGVGKTVLTGAIALSLRRQGLSVVVCKPVQSGALADDPAGDAALLEAWVGECHCFESFAAPLAPLVAAEREGRAIDQAALVERIRGLESGYDLLLVEGAGGLLAPLGDDWTVADLAVALAFPLLVVARPGLGTVNHTLLTLAAARGLGLPVAGVVLNGNDPEAETNASLIESFGETRVLGRTPWLAGTPDAEQLLALADHVHLDSVLMLESARA